MTYYLNATKAITFLAVLASLFAFGNEAHSQSFPYAYGDSDTAKVWNAKVKMYEKKYSRPAHPNSKKIRDNIVNHTVVPAVGAAKGAYSGKKYGKPGMAAGAVMGAGKTCYKCHYGNK